MHSSSSVRKHTRVNWDVVGVEKTINSKKKEFRDMNAQENIEKLNQELMDVNKIMTESFDMLLNRDNNLNKIVSDSANLRDSSKDVSKSKRLN